MKIKSLFISKYKNIEDINLQFNSDLITLLVGQNGLGKSNLLEAIALVFRDLDLLEKEEEFEDWPFHENHFFYDILYECKNNEIRIQCLEKIFRVYSKPLGSTVDLQWVDFNSFKRNKDKFIPDYILGYYSGNNHRIKSFFEAHSNIRLKNLKNRHPNPKFPALGKMFFTEENHIELLFFSMLIFKESTIYGEKIKKLLDEYLKIDFNSKVLIGFNNPSFAKNFPEKNADNLVSNIQDGVEFPFWGIKGDIDVFLNVLWNNNSSYSMPIAFEDQEFDLDKNKNGFISFNDLNFSKLMEDLAGKIDDPIHLFDVLLAADELGVIYKINTEISKNGQALYHDFRQLSEGEQQLLTVLGLILVAGRDDCLFLLDEPDTHLNPKWQRNYVKLLEEFNLNDNNSHILVATHSPLIVQAAEDSDILLYKLNDDKKVEIINNEKLKIHNWRIDQVLGSEFFEFNSTRPPKLDDFMTLREKMLDEGLNDDTKNKLDELQNEFGVLPTGETMEELESILLIKSFANRLKSNDQN
jgi:predicted ATPase